jgi:hypothetical protein
MAKVCKFDCYMAICLHIQEQNYCLWDVNLSAEWNFEGSDWHLMNIHIMTGES